MKYYYVVEGDLRNNIGDVLQGMVAKPFLPGENAFPADRELMDQLDNETPGLILANGWYMHNFENFPPPDNIEPIYISVHVANSGLLKTKKVRDHFRRFSPIGCRDNKTKKLFLGWGIPAYYSGCLTITTEAKAEINNSGKGEALLVDNVDHPIPDKLKQKLESMLGDKLVRVSHDPPDTSGAFEDYVDQSSRHMNSLLERYCKARIVITTKIHCTLPCLGMGANVMLIHPNPSDPRLETVKEFIEIFSYEDVLKMKQLTLPKVDHQKLKDRKDFLRDIVEHSVSEKHNIIIDGEDEKFSKIRKKSKRNAKIYRFIVKLMLKLGVKKAQVKKVYG